VARCTALHFRAEHVVSLIRQPMLPDACQAHLEGKLPVAQWHALKNNLIREAITVQERGEECCLMASSAVPRSAKCCWRASMAIAAGVAPSAVSRLMTIC